jgi:hypothetical protein
MRKWWMCSKGKFCEEYMALLRTETSGGAGLTRNFMTFLKRLSVVIRIAWLWWAGHVARMDENSMPMRLDVQVVRNEMMLGLKLRSSKGMRKSMRSVEVVSLLLAGASDRTCGVGSACM